MPAAVFNSNVPEAIAKSKQLRKPLVVMCCAGQDQLVAFEQRHVELNNVAVCILLQSGTADYQQFDQKCTWK